MTALDPDLLKRLVCPVTRGQLAYLPDRQLLVCEAAGLAYPVHDAVPILLAEEAMPWPETPDSVAEPA